MVLHAGPDGHTIGVEVGASAGLTPQQPKVPHAGFEDSHAVPGCVVLHSD